MSKSYFRFKVPKDSIPIIEEFVKKEYPKSFEANLCRYLYVVEYVHMGMYAHRKKVPVNREQLKQNIGVNNTKATKILKDLCNLGILEKSGNYLSGVTSNSYTLKDTSKITTSIPFSVFTHKATKNIIERKNMKKRDNTIFENTLEAELLAKYLLSIDIDSTLITNIISFPLFTFSYLSPYVYQHREEDEAIQEFKSEFKNIVSIYNKEIFIKRNNNKGRVFTNFTVMDKDHRPYLSYKGQTLKCLDIANSQPLIFCAFLKKYCEENNIPIPTEEYDVYKNLVEKGLFYERFMEGDDLLPENRKDFKKEFFGSVFYTKVSNIPYKLRKRFVKVFPKIYKIMDDIKFKHGNDGFALMMQEEEARIVWDNVNAPMLREGYLCYNIYDSIVSHDIDTIKEAEIRLRAEFGKLGISPTFKLEVFE